MALSVTINKVSTIFTTIPANTKIADVVVNGGTSPYNYSLAIGEDSFQLVGTQVQTKVAMTLSNIAPFSVTVSDNTPTTPETVTSPSTYPNIQANFQNKFNREDIVYKVTKVYDLQHGVLTIPSRSTLLFEGGAFYNGTLKFDDVTINSDSNGSYAIFTDVAIEGHISGGINVKWFGAKGDGISDDSIPIQQAINAISSNYSNKGSGSIFIPTPDKYYRLEHTLDISELWNAHIYCDSLLYGSREGVKSLFVWDGPANYAMMLGHYTFGVKLENLSFNGNNIAGVIGLQLSQKNTQNSSAKFMKVSFCKFQNCDIGMVIGAQNTEVSPDDAFINIDSCTFTGNKSQGLNISGGNTSVNCSSIWFGSNGKNPSGSNVGANLYFGGGQLDIYGYVSGGNSDDYPKDGDIYQNYGGLRIFGAWSDTPGLFINSVNANFASVISGARHYEGSMTAENTPKSIVWTGPQPLTLMGCYLFNSVELLEGQGGQVINIGTIFKTAGASFIGTQITTYHGYSSIGEYNYVGRPDKPSGLNGSAKSMIWSKKYGINQVKTIGDFTVTDYINSDNGQYTILGNAYSDVTTANHIAISTGKCFKIAFTNDSMTYSIADGTEGQVITWTDITKGGTYYNGSYIQLGKNKLIIQTEPPIQGTWEKGDLAMNGNPTLGSPSGWICSEGGSPGTWVALGMVNSNAIGRGETNQRPTLTSAENGFIFYDKTLSKIIVWNGVNWVNADGTTL